MQGKEIWAIKLLKMFFESQFKNEVINVKSKGPLTSRKGMAGKQQMKEEIVWAVAGKLVEISIKHTKSTSRCPRILELTLESGGALSSPMVGWG